MSSGSGRCGEVNINKLDQKTIAFSHWMSFGWKVFEVNGHDFTTSLTAFKKVRKVKNQPTDIDEWGWVNG